MISRKTVLLTSVLMSMAMYAGLYAAAPSILLIRVSETRDSILKTFKVDLDRTPAQASTRKRDPEPAPSLTSRPGSVRDLLKDLTQAMDLPEAEAVAVPEPTPVAETLTRDHALEKNETILADVEARLLAIPEDRARAHVEVARRFVRDNDSRLLAAGDLPVLGGGTADDAVVGLPGAIAGQGSGIGSAMRDVRGGSANDTPVRETPHWSEITPLDAGPEDNAIPGLEDDTLIARNAVRSQVRAARPYEVLDRFMQLEATTYVDPTTGEGFFRLRIVPEETPDIRPLPRDITFVIDASKSISQRKLDLTVRGLSQSLPALRPEDRFNIVVFRDTAHMFRDKPVPAIRENIDAALDYITGLESKGSTDVYGAVRSVLLQRPREGVPRIVVVISDGRPSEGKLKGRNLINALSEENRLANTVYTYGGGNTVNRYLLDLLAYRNRGASRVSSRIEDIDEELPAFLARLQDALLVNLRADYGRIDETSVYPRALPDFYRGRVVTVYGKFTPGDDKELVLRLQGVAGASQKEIVLRGDLSEASRGDRSIAEGWAFAKTYDLIGEITRVGDRPELTAELARLSRDYGVQTSYSP